MQLPGDGEVPFGVADGRVEFVFPELVAQPGVDFILLPGGESGDVQRPAELVDPLLAFPVEDALVFEHVVELSREGAGFGLFAGRQRRQREQHREAFAHPVCVSA